MVIEKEYRIWTAQKEIVVFYLIACVAVYSCFTEPEFFDVFSVQGTGLKLSLQMSGIFCQLISGLMLAFRVYRGSNAVEMARKHDVLMNNISSELTNYLENPRDKENLSKVMQHPKVKKDISNHFEPVLDFGETERKVALAGIALFIVGGVLQAFSAG
ncbi:hypothetical protein Q9252_14625 [Marinobacter salarius]|uniref:hypothetical protein n=1 Tax=Marinobacter salarius TaxID=1420917 RepID=UPI00273C846B|nr:hypothetical protein [Marinobacter salarius]MDP4533380.1 hypothetical protein [Marinobacter salarius]